MGKCKRCGKLDEYDSPSGFCFQCWQDVGGRIYSWDKLKKCNNCGEWKVLNNDGICSDCMINEALADYDFRTGG